MDAGHRFLDAIPTLAWSARPGGSNEFVNRRWHEYTGLSAEEGLGWGWKTVVHPEDLGRLTAKWESIAAKGEPGESEARLRRADGVYRWFLFRVEPRRDDARQVVEWYGTATDIEDRMRAESLRAAEKRTLEIIADGASLEDTLNDLCRAIDAQSLPVSAIEAAGKIALIAIDRQRSLEAVRKSEAEMRQITDAIAQSIAVIGVDGQVLYANRVLLDYTGLRLEDLRSLGLRQRVVHPDDVERLQGQRQQGLSGCVPFELEARLRRHDGKYRWFLVRYNPLRDERGSVIRWYATSTDIDERKQAEDRIRNENLALREEIAGSSMFEEIVGSSGALRQLLSQIAKVAPTDSTVLITGETGTGKELVARAIHAKSKRAARAFVRLNCAAIPQALIASELFGHEKGAFTGALQRRIGRFESAEGGTLFLDEVGELPAETQIALLRVLQEREFERLGSNHPIQADVRVLTATNRDLKAAVAEGKFREDLFYRLNVFPIAVPSLRDRADDIPLLVEYLVRRSARRAGKKIRHIDKASLDLFKAYGWPGNVRELQNVIERAVILCEGDTLSVDPTWFSAGASLHEEREKIGPSSPGKIGKTDALGEREKIQAALRDSKGRIAGPFGAASKLGIPRQTLDSKIAALGIDKHQFRH
jgi:formate hydrogenlyase transcriptional activator